jgi:hypothetical protein
VRGRLFLLLAVTVIAAGCKRPETPPAATTPSPVAIDTVAPTKPVITDISVNRAAADTVSLMSSLEKSAVPYTKELPSAEIPGYRAGIEAYKAGDWVTAQRELRNAAREQKLDWEIWFYAGIAAYMNGDTREAVQGCLMVERYSAPEGPRMQARWYQANAYLKEGHMTRGRKVLEFIARQNKQYADEARALLRKIIDQHVVDGYSKPDSPGDADGE